MKTALLKTSLVAAAILFAGAQTVPAAGFLSIDADARYVNTDFSHDDFLLKTLGVVVRQVVADESADRWVLYGQLEVMDNFDRADIHQMYVMYKGPMGAWNVYAGRVRLPYGLLTGYSTDHAGFAALDPYTLGRESDNGAMAGGTIGMFDYALAITQGNGIFDHFPEAGLVTGRVAVTPGIAGDFSIGLSGAAGESLVEHDAMPMAKPLKLGALDVQGTSGRLTYRTEFSAGRQLDNVQTALFAGADFSASSRIEINVAASAVREAGAFHHAWGFVGTTFNTGIILLKGGYKYVHYGPIDHQITLMAYKQFSFNF